MMKTGMQEAMCAARIIQERGQLCPRVPAASAPSCGQACPRSISCGFAACRYSSLLHADAIEERAGACGIGVRVTGHAGLTGDVGLNGGERRLCSKVGAALEIIRSRVHALPAYDQA